MKKNRGIKKPDGAVRMTNKAGQRVFFFRGHEYLTKRDLVNGNYIGKQDVKPVIEK